MASPPAEKSHLLQRNFILDLSECIQFQKSDQEYKIVFLDLDLANEFKPHTFVATDNKEYPNKGFFDNTRYEKLTVFDVKDDAAWGPLDGCSFSTFFGSPFHIEDAKVDVKNMAGKFLVKGPLHEIYIARKNKFQVDAERQVARPLQGNPMYFVEVTKGLLEQCKKRPDIFNVVVGKDAIEICASYGGTMLVFEGDFINVGAKNTKSDVSEDGLEFYRLYGPVFRTTYNKIGQKTKSPRGSLFGCLACGTGPQPV